MTDGNPDGKVENLMNELDSTAILSNPNQEESEMADNVEELSKEELANKFDVRFAKSAKGDTQHLTSPEGDAIFCRTSLTDGFTTSEDPSPFDPICMRCRKNVTGGTQASNPGNTVADYRQWLANEIDGVKEPEGDGTSAKSLRKTELAAVVVHIQSLKENQ